MINRSQRIFGINIKLETGQLMRKLEETAAKRHIRQWGTQLAAQSLSDS
jgi:hypothetical protein